MENNDGIGCLGTLIILIVALAIVFGVISWAVSVVFSFKFIIGIIAVIVLYKLIFGRSSKSH